MRRTTTSPGRVPTDRALLRHGLVAAVLLGLAGCGGGPSPAGGPQQTPPPAPAADATAPTAPAAPGGGTGSADAGTPAANPTDVMFLQMMLEHRRPAGRLLQLAAERATDAEVRMLAAAIEATEATDAATMARWLREWGEPETADPNPSLHAHHGGLPLLGTDQIAAVTAASGAEFDRTFLNVLIGHQHNAVDLARMELDGGAHPDVQELARRVERSRRAQISQMLRMMSRLSG